MTSLLSPLVLPTVGLVPWAVGRFYSAPVAFVAFSSTKVIADNVYTCIFFVPNLAGVTVTSLGIEVTAFATVSLRMGIYDMDESGGPGKLILDAGTLSLAGSNGFKSIGSLSQFLKPGWYFVVGATNVITGVTVRAFSTTGPIPLLGSLEEQDSQPPSDWTLSNGGTNSPFAMYNDGLPKSLAGVLVPNSGGSFPRFMVGI